MFEAEAHSVMWMRDKDESLQDAAQTALQAGLRAVGARKAKAAVRVLPILDPPETLEAPESAIPSEPVEA